VWDGESGSSALFPLRGFVVWLSEFTQAGVTKYYNLGVPNHRHLAYTVLRLADTNHGARGFYFYEDSGLDSSLCVVSSLGREIALCPL
jgi:hypothetical protein